jgi:hypothetical protein
MKTRSKQVLIMLVLLYVVLCIGFSQKLFKGFGTIENVQGTNIIYENLGKPHSILSTMDIRSSKR